MDFGEQDVRTGELILRCGHQIDNIFDIGASDSAWARVMRPIFPTSRFDLFEPLVHDCDQYRDGLETFLANDTNAKLHDVAIGKADSEATMVMTPDPVGSTIIPVAESALGTRLKVPVRSIDSLIAAGDAPIPDLIKSDTQGSELALLQGACETLPHVQFLALETWLTRGYGVHTPLLVELMQFLREYYFFPYEIAEIFRTPNGYVAAIDVWFINQKLAKTPRSYYSGDAGSAEQTIVPANLPQDRTAADRAILHSALTRGYKLKCMFDIGAGNGSWSSEIAKEIDEAHFELFDPLAELDPGYAKSLAAHLRNYPNWVIHPIAVGAHDGTATLQQTEVGTGSTLLPLQPTLIGAKSVEVPLRSLDALLQTGTVGRPDLIHIQTRGGELEALRGASGTLAKTTFLVIETWFVRGYGAQTPLFSELAEHLFHLGFVPFEFGEPARSETGQLVKANVWFVTTADSRVWYYKWFKRGLNRMIQLIRG